MELSILRAMAIRMYHAAVDTKIPDGFGVQVILIAVSKEGSYVPVTNGMDGNTLIGILHRCAMSIHATAQVETVNQETVQTPPSDTTKESQH